MLPHSGLCKVASSTLLSPDMKTTVIALRCTVNQDNSAVAAGQLSFDVNNEADIPICVLLNTMLEPSFENLQKLARSCNFTFLWG